MYYVNVLIPDFSHLEKFHPLIVPSVLTNPLVPAASLNMGMLLAK